MTYQQFYAKHHTDLLGLCVSGLLQSRDSGDTGLWLKMTMMKIDEKLRAMHADLSPQAEAAPATHRPQARPNTNGR
ncbi:MAG TPA: hypothetical protein VM529_11015 [Gemmata sp.]|nr:hypothetical protein [Gemmata sp.]